MKKYILLFIILFLTPLKIWAQESDDSYIPNLIPPSPISEELGRYGNVPVGLFTGSPNINIPIYTFKSKNITVPISASYSSNGVKVDEVSKQLGMSWNLIAGGVITRTVRKAPDEKSTFLNLNNYPNAINCNTNNDPQLMSTLQNNVDTEKDIFTFNVPGIISGKFYYGSNGITQLEPSNIKIENISTKDSQADMAFKITDTEGTEYYFGEYAVSIENVRGKTSSGTTPYSVNTAWYLTRIKSIDNNEIIFTYDRKRFMYISSYSQYAQGDYSNYGKLEIFATMPKGVEENNAIPYLIYIQNGKGDKVEFIYDIFQIPAQGRKNESSQLTKITITNSNTIIKSFSFNYDLVSVSNSESNAYTKLNDKRIFLKNIQEISPANELIKQHAFEYYSPELLPARHSFAKDLYGYYNRANNFDLIYNNIPINNKFGQDLINIFKANRNSAPLVSYYGMLKNIIYPTGGITEIQYEPNSVSIDEYVVPPPIPQENVFVYSNSRATGSRIDSKDFYVPFTQNGKLTITIDFDEGDPKCEYDPIHNKTGGNVKLIDSKGNIIDSKNYTSELLYYYPRSLDKGQYKIIANAIRKCTYVSGTIYYSKIPPYWQKVNKPFAGNRVSRTIDYSNNGKEKYIKKYYYANSMDKLEISSGEFATLSPNFRPNYDIFADGAKEIIYMYTTPPVPLYSSDGYAIVYPSVIESLGGDNFEQGGIQHSFSMNQEEFPNNICNSINKNGDTDRNTSMGNAFMNGNPLSVVKFKKEGNNIKTVESLTYKYAYKEDMSSRFTNYVVKHIGNIKWSWTGGTGKQYLFMVDEYYINSQKYYLSSTISNKYDINGQNPVEIVTYYQHNSPNHLQLTSQITTTSTGGELITNYQYPPDINGNPLMQALTSQNRISTPVTTEVLRKQDGSEKQISFTETRYAQDASTANLILPKYIYTKKGESVLEKKITYDSYDNKGNLLQYTLESGIPVSIIWGYNQQHPIAKIEGASYSEIESYVINLQNLSNNSDEQGLLSAYTSLRNKLPLAMITTYTYLPLIGVSTITPPNGLTEYYTYDDAGRLKEIKNQDGQLLKSYEYHYRSQN